jgi:23S rRNA pseudouridine2605 synthase
MVAADDSDPRAEPVRLAKHLAHAGVASRRAAERIVAEGRVRVAGQLVTDPARDVTGADEVTVDGRLLGGREAPVVYALNKPPGVVSTASDTHGRPIVTELIDAPSVRLYPVGRLDAESSGLILLTNDGDLANRLTHPRYEVPKVYRVKVGGGPVAQRALRALREGVQLEDGRTGPALVRSLGQGELELTISEGRNRQVRRMCEAIGHPVRELTRIAFGGLLLGNLKPGAYRRLGAAEIARLRAGKLS